MKINALWWLLLTQMASAQVDNLSLSGFGTLGIMSSDSSKYGSRLDISQNDGSFNSEIDYENSTALGLQVDYAHNKNSYFVLQSIYHSQIHLDPDSTTRLAFARFSPTPEWSLRLGRTAIDLFLLTQFRDVGFGYTWAHTPTEIYGLLPFRHLDGADITYHSRLFGVNFDSILYTGNSSTPIAGYNFETEIKLKDVYGASFNLNTYDWSLQWRYSNAILKADRTSYAELIEGLIAISQIPDLWPDSDETIAALESERTGVEYISFSGQYDWGRWSYLAEASTIQPKKDLIPNSTSGYTSIVFHDSNVSYYATYAVSQSDGIDTKTRNVNLEMLEGIVGGPELFAAVNAGLSIYSSNQATVSLGWRWNIASNLALKAQWDNTIIEEKGGTLWLNKNTSTNPSNTVNTLSTNVSFIF